MPFGTPPEMNCIEKSLQTFSYSLTFFKFLDPVDEEIAMEQVHVILRKYRDMKLMTNLGVLKLTDVLIFACERDDDRSTSNKSTMLFSRRLSEYDYRYIIWSTQRKLVLKRSSAPSQFRDLNFNVGFATVYCFFFLSFI